MLPIEIGQCGHLDASGAHGIIYKELMSGRDNTTTIRCSVAGDIIKRDTSCGMLAFIN